TRDDDLLALGVGDVAHVAGKADRTGRLGLDAARGGGARRRTTDVEGTHRELGARLTDRLRVVDADGLAGVDFTAATEVTAVALGADAVAGFAGQRGADLDLVDAEAVDQLDQLLAQQRTGLDDGFLVVRVDQILGRDTTQDALTQ